MDLKNFPKELKTVCLTDSSFFFLEDTERLSRPVMSRVAKNVLT